MGRIAWIAIALVFLTAAPAAQAGWLRLLEDTGKVAKDAEATSHAVKIENKVVGLEATGASVEANAVKVETRGGGSGGGGDDDPPVWFYVLCVVGVGGWLLLKIRARQRDR